MCTAHFAHFLQQLALLVKQAVTTWFFTAYGTKHLLLAEEGLGVHHAQTSTKSMYNSNGMHQGE